MIQEDKLVDFHLEKRKKKGCFGRILNLFWLPFLIFLGSIAAWMGYINLRMEMHSVLMIGAIFVIYLFFMKHNAYYAACKFKRRQSRLGSELEKYIDKNLLEIGGVHKANAPFDAFIKNFSDSLRNDNFASVAGAVFPTLGILGTFVSIALTMPDFSSQDSAQLEKEISQLLGGVGTAFYVSIYGIFLSLWWIFFEKKGMSEFEKSVRSIRENTRHFFWTREEIEQVHFTQSLKNFDNLNELFSKISSNEFIDSIQHSLEQRLNLFDSIIHHEQNAFQKSTEHFDNIVKLSEKSMQVSNQLFDSYENIRLKMEEVVKSLETSQKLLRLVNQELTLKEDALSSVTGKLSQSIEKLTKALDNINADNVKELYGAVLQNVEIMKSETSKIGYAYNKHLENFDEAYTNKLRTSLEMIDSETAKIIRQLSSLRDMK
ncbi:MAG: hypothetical protein DSZ05_05475 [Sulfurospirillum sp.]|nr:MAG: hypothetical protein DSZ05_05475 [Sulfurospirillum sp.]